MWLKGRKHIKSLDNVPEGAFGFVYLITNKTNGRFYIGKKQFFYTRKKKISKTEKKQTKTKKRFKYITYESDWLTYMGSAKSEEYTRDIDAGHEFEKKILAYAFTNKELIYLEAKHQFIYEVLENKQSYNNNILGQRGFYPTDLTANDRGD